jgi:NAD(P)-dependent dehydrogenase (short-subunit alcohol dehydrogenase family)
VSEGNKNLIIGAAAAAGLMGLAVYASRGRYSFRDKVVLITGGSRGLGLVMAREFARRGAKIAICARDSDELLRAKEDLESRGAEVSANICDLREKPDVEKMIGDVRSRFGRIDVLVNNAGVIQVGPLELQTQEDFEEAMKIHFWAPFHTMQAVIPEMRERGEGRIVNIVSIGGKIAVPHLAPYCASKFALAGLSAAMGVELAKFGINVTTVYPGLMRTGSHINAFFKGQHRAEYALFSLMGSSPLTSINAESAARQIVRAARRGDTELILSPQAKLAAKINALFPEFTGGALSLTNRVLPGEGGIGTDLVPGRASTSAIAPSILTALADKASVKNNELGARPVM